MKGDFLWAVVQMKEGKKVRRPNYGKGAYKMMMDDGFIGYQGSGRLPHFKVKDYEATDWEIVSDETEKKSLSDYILFGIPNILDKDLTAHPNVIPYEITKEKLEEYRSKLRRDGIIVGAKYAFEEDVAKEIFGERLL